MRRSLSLNCKSIKPVSEFYLLQNIFSEVNKEKWGISRSILTAVIDLVSGCASAIYDVDDAVAQELAELKQVEGIHEGEQTLIVATRSQTDFYC